MTWNRNRGYVGNSMSVRAADAYDDGALPLSKVTAAWLREHEIGCTRAELLDLIAEGVVGTGEWHHTGGFFAKTSFHRPEELREQVAALTTEQIAAARTAAKARRATGKASTVHRDCVVKWIEWSGTTSRPKAKDRQAEHATVTVRGETATITLADGTTFQKRLHTNGFWFQSDKDRRAAEREKAVLRKTMYRMFAEKAKGHRFERHVPRGDWERITHREMRDRLEFMKGLDDAIRFLPRIDRHPEFGIGDGAFYRLVPISAKAAA
ncbi:hypothetical protein PP568_06755 [Mycobacteroides abscessus]|uniref:Uncharacterized protein n=1 Tax=Mycobacteroides abscessus subsp. abscessus TaxID=1185650 RepID=A0AB38D3T0_9MYCO|nr:hypothetical protein [Mycobacteroides abscessus]MBE5419555.1 hypothetical protein [Mycobacteroides abscessus]MBE5455746.1 hypothetical protein [Mycobacteroides abscessus]MBN7463085.1 hypothetical protein [Mycobacteroides abscessus subsp. abscessus]MBN7555238.1 hypothetical protein [Mycobacteroides abscessus subsp. abscessus]MDM2404630.1 hypothetical protein [Mycobacteroides abscessus]